ncbi:MAG: hypothetical protein LBU79_07580, partial [Planctomycetota bacterium]|nr:hypothetical protein [Planctomycetota bacterium]
RIVGYQLNDKIQEQTRQAALLMEKMFDVYASLEEMPLPPGEEMPIWLHLSRPEYERQAARYNFPPGLTTGFCNVDGEVHLYYKRVGRLSPESTLMHEGFHQYCHRAMHLPTPPEVLRSVPGYSREKLTTVPLWLAEGMAMNMETGRIETEHNGLVVRIDDIGSVNRERLRQLVEIIKANRCPSIRDIMNKIMGDQLSSDDYAVMWGLVFDLRLATGNAIFIREQRELERAGPETVNAAIQAATDPARPYPYLRWPVPVVGRLLRACRVAWGLDVPATIAECATGAGEPRDFDRRWNRKLTQVALEEVERLLRDQGLSLEEWELNWRLRMLTLGTEVRGGKYVYTEPDSISRAANRASRGNPKTGIWN